jgi:hypothetical protein
MQSTLTTINFIASAFGSQHDESRAELENENGDNAFFTTKHASNSVRQPRSRDLGPREGACSAALLIDTIRLTCLG